MQRRRKTQRRQNGGGVRNFLRKLCPGGLCEREAPVPAETAVAPSTLASMATNGGPVRYRHRRSSMNRGPAGAPVSVANGSAGVYNELMASTANARASYAEREKAENTRARQAAGLAGRQKHEEIKEKRNRGVNVRINNETREVRRAEEKAYNNIMRPFYNAEEARLGIFNAPTTRGGLKHPRLTRKRLYALSL